VSQIFHKYVLEPFINVSEKGESRNSFCINEKFYSYSDFNSVISKIRTAIKKGAVDSTNIGVVVNDDIETYAAIFAIWLEGYAYVPLHPHQPYERCVEIIKLSNLELVIDSSSKTRYENYRTINSSNIQDVEVDLKPNLVSDDSLAYILFTSGSTGTPKGVQITRKNVGTFMKAFWDVGFAIDQNDRCLQSFDLTFDVSVQSFLVPLTRGACVYTIPHNQIKYSYIYGLLEEHKITFGAFAPSMIRYLKPYFGEIKAPDMRYNILTAEACPYDLLVEWSECIPNSEIYDFYGPTEATVYCTYDKFSRKGSNKVIDGMMSIGKPMNGIKVAIIDENCKVLDYNQNGELCLSGDQVSPGYWGNETKNSECFFNLEIGGLIERYYKTGDLCSIDENGYITLYGRLDNQVKIQGYRVELGEIEYHVRECLPGIANVAMAYENSSGNKQIALFVENEPFEIDLLLKYLGSKMPNYMIPSLVKFIPVFPLNYSSKIDRQRLKTFL
jgi:D-alanine--poly(phosphoribitol) ligase subunit 1